MINYNTITELKQAQLVVGDLVQVLGENQVGDRGVMNGIVRVQGHTTANRLVNITQGLCVEIMPEVVITDEDLSYSSVVANGTTFRRQLRDRFTDTVSLKDFGGICDGVTNDTPAIHAMIKYLSINGGVGLLPAGRIGVRSTTYKPTLTNGIHKPFELRGAGIGGTVLYNLDTDVSSSGSSGHIVAMSDFESGLIMSGFTIDAGRDRFTNSASLISGNGAHVLVGCQNVFIERVKWENFTAVGLMSYNDHPGNPSKTYHNLHIEQCYADGTTYWRPGSGSGPDATYGSGILVADMNDSSIINCHTYKTSQYSIEYKNSCARTIIGDCTIKDAYNGLYYGGNSALKDERYVKDSVMRDCIMTRVKNPIWLGVADRNHVSNIVIDNRGIDNDTLNVVIRDGNHNTIKGIRVYGRSTYLIDIRSKSSYNSIEFDYIEDADNLTVHGGNIAADSLYNTVIYPENYKSNAEFIHFSQRKLPNVTLIDKKKNITIKNTTTRQFSQLGAIASDKLPMASTWTGFAEASGGEYRCHRMSSTNYTYDNHYKIGTGGYSSVFMRANVTTTPDYRLYLQTSSSSSDQMSFVFSPDRFYTSKDAEVSSGASSARWSVVFAAQGTINTSDMREKTAPITITDEVLDAWGDVQLIAFQWLDAIRVKGEDVARIHYGVMAQQVRDAFAARGIDGTRFGLLCYDEWDETVDCENGKVTPAGDRWGIRPDQCLFLEAAYQRRRCDRIEARLDKAGI